jgi:6-phosphogluconolactonase
MVSTIRCDNHPLYERVLVRNCSAMNGRIPKRHFAQLLLASSMLLAGCGGGTSSSEVPKNFNTSAVGYVANLLDNTVTSFLLDETTGALANGATASTGAKPAFPVVSPDGHFLFVSNSEDGTISRFALDGNGGMLAGAPAVALVNPLARPYDLAVAPSGNFLYVGTIPNAVEVFSINKQTGALIAIEGSPFYVPSEASQIVLTHSGRFLYALGDHSDSIYMFSVDAATGVLATLGTLHTGLDPAGLATDPSDNYLVIGTAFTEKVFVYRIDASGILQQTAVSQASSGLAAMHPTFSADGRFLFTEDPYTNGILAYTFDAATGLITPVPGSPFLDNQSPTSVAVSPSGNILVVSRLNPGHVASFRIDPKTGVLTPISGTLSTSGIVTGYNPNHVLLVRK